MGDKRKRRSISETFPEHVRIIIMMKYRIEIVSRHHLVTKLKFENMSELLIKNFTKRNFVNEYYVASLFAYIRILFC